MIFHFEKSQKLEIMEIMQISILHSFLTCSPYPKCRVALVQSTSSGWVPTVRCKNEKSRLNTDYDTWKVESFRNFHIKICVQSSKPLSEASDCICWQGIDGIWPNVQLEPRACTAHISATFKEVQCNDGFVVCDFWKLLCFACIKVSAALEYLAFGHFGDLGGFGGFGAVVTVSSGSQSLWSFSSPKLKFSEKAGTASCNCCDDRTEALRTQPLERPWSHLGQISDTITCWTTCWTTLVWPLQRFEQNLLPLSRRG